MNDDRVVFVSDDEAGRLWKRAAELQVAESRRVERRSRDLNPAPNALVRGQQASHHFPLAEVLAAAREVGIDEEFLETAVSELREERAAGEPPPLDLIERWASRFFGSPPLTLEVTARIAAPVERVYAILQRLLPAEPYQLRLRDTLGGDPLVDGTLVFDAPETTTAPGSYARRILMARDRIRRLYVTVRSAEVENQVGCRVTVRARVEADPEPAFWLGSALTGGAGGLGSVVGAATAIGMGFGGALLLLPAAVAGGAVGFVTYRSYRTRYVHPLARAQRALGELVEVLRAAVKTGGGFLPADRAGGRRHSDPTSRDDHAPPRGLQP